MLVLSYAGIAIPSAKGCWQIDVRRHLRCPMAHPTISLPQTFVVWLWPYPDAFSRHTRSTVAALAVGSLTVANLLRTLGLADDPGFAAFHRVLNRNRWSGLKLARVMLNALVSTFVPNGPIIVGIDHTLERHRGVHVRPASHCFDSVRTSTEQTVTSRGLRWMTAMLLVEVPFSGRIWGLPVPSAMVPSRARCEAPSGSPRLRAPATEPGSMRRSTGAIPKLRWWRHRAVTPC